MKIVLAARVVSKDGVDKMTKRKVIEVIEEYNDAGKLIRKVTTETTEDDDSSVNISPYPWWNYPYAPTVQYSDKTADAVPMYDYTITCSATNGTKATVNNINAQ